MATYYVTLPNSGVTAEVTADTTRQARTAYLDYMTRSNQVPWKGRQDLREQLLIDKIVLMYYLMSFFVIIHSTNLYL